MNTRDTDRIGQDFAAQARDLFHTRIEDPVVIRHVEEMHKLLSLWQARTSVLTSSWLLVLVKHELIPDHELTVRFGQRTLNLTRLACKIIFTDTHPEQIKRNSTRATYAELTRRLFVYAYHDYEAVLITIADQLATAAQYDQMNENERLEWAQRSQSVFLPLLEMFGLWKHRSELGNISLYILNAIQYEQLDNQVGRYRERHQLFYDSIVPELENALLVEGLKNVDMRLHLTTPASLSKRIEQLRRRGEQPKAHDMGALCIDVLLENDLECYLALGIIHHCWKPALRHPHLNPSENVNEHRFYDYIASPRYNGYRCLITTILCDIRFEGDNKSVKQLVEFRLRTHQMEQVNLYGITAAVLDPTPIRNTWWVNQPIREIVKPGSTDYLKTTSEICVFTPNGEVIYPLAAGSTLIDFAFKIHSHIGSYAKSFLVNGRPVSADYELRHRDLVEIEYDLTFPSIHPEWEDIARLASTKACIRRFFKLRDRAPHKGRQLIDEVLQRETAIYQMRFPAEKIEAILAKIARDLNCASVDGLYMRVCEGIVSPDEVVATMIEAELVGHIAFTSEEDFPTNRIRIAQTWMQEKDTRKWDRKSRVLPGVEIVGKLSGRDKNQMLTVYRKDSRFAPAGDQAVELRWRTSEDNREAVEVTITAPAKSHVIGMVFNSVYGVGKDNEQSRINIHRFNAEMQDSLLNLTLVIDCASVRGVQSLENALKVIQRSGYISEFKIWQLFPNHKKLIASRSDKRQQNPYTLKQVGNRGMFYGRQDEIRKAIENIHEGHLVVLYGQKRIGKTSLLNQLAENLLPQHGDFFPVVFDVHRLSPFDTSSFLFGLVEAALSKLDVHFKRPEERKGLKFRKRDLAADPFKAFAAWVNLVQQRLQGTRLVFLIDEFTRAEEECQQGNIDSSFFDGLQWLAGDQNIAFVLCVHDHIMAREGNKSWGLLQRGKPVRLDALDRTSAERLVQQPLENHYKLEHDLVSRILYLSNCHPYLIQVICHTLTAQMSQGENDTMTSNDLDRAVREVLINGDHYFSHLRSRASDHDWDILKIIAYITDADKPWVTSDEIRNAMKRFGFNTEGWRISKSIGDLRHAGIIEATETHHQAMYRIPIGLFHLWLRQIVTHLTVSRDLQRED